MYNYLNYKSLFKGLFLLLLIGSLNKAQAQTDSLLQTLLVEEKIDSQLIAPKKMLFTQQLIWGNNGIFKNRYGSTQDLVERRKIDLRIRRKMLQLHQIGGFVTLGGMVAQGIIGSQLYNGSYKLKETHEKLGAAVNLSYGFTAINGLFTPPSTFKRDKKLTSIRLHKLLRICQA
jgi:predicted Zn-dependent peptidase